MPEALRHLLPTDLTGLPVAAMAAYLLAASAFNLAAGVVLGWAWGRR